MHGLAWSQMERLYAGFVCSGLCLKANSDLRRKWLQMEIAFTAAEPRSKEAEMGAFAI